MNTREIVHDMLDKLDDKQINALKIIIEGLVNEAADPQNTVKNKLKTVLSGLFLLLFGLLLYNFFAANSASAYFGLISVFFVSLVLFRKKIKIWIKPIICLVLTLVLVMCMLTDRWVPEIKKIWESEVKIYIENIYADSNPEIQYDYENPPGRTRCSIDYIESFEGYMLFSVAGNAIKITRDDSNSSFLITDEYDNQLYLRSIPDEDGYFEILDDRFHDFIRLSLARIEDYPCVVFSTIWDDWVFRYDGNHFLYQNAVGKEVLLKEVPHSSLFNYKMGSSRGLIWSTTLPLLKSYLIKGAGADSFCFVYPQYDYATLYSVLGRYNLSLVTDKAHNLYMQYWVNTGLISLLAWLAMVGYYLVAAGKQFRKHGFNDFVDFVNGGIFCGICGFLAIALFNDGSVNTMPMFYTMLGTGLAINMKDRWELKDEPSGGNQLDMPEL